MRPAGQDQHRNGEADPPARSTEATPSAERTSAACTDPPLRQELHPTVPPFPPIYFYCSACRPAHKHVHSTWVVGVSSRLRCVLTRGRPLWICVEAVDIRKSKQQTAAEADSKTCYGYKWQANSDTACIFPMLFSPPAIFFFFEVFVFL